MFRRDVIGDVKTRPSPRPPVPPDQLLALAPRRTVRACRGAVVEDAAIGGPREPPAVTEIIARPALVGAIAPRLGIDARVDPATARRRAVGLQLCEAGEQRAVGDATAVDLLQHVLDVGLARRSRARIVPRQRVQSGVARARIARGLLLHPPSQVEGEPRVTTRISRRAFPSTPRPGWKANHASLRQSPGGPPAFCRHCPSRCVLVKQPSFSTCPAAGIRKTSVLMSVVLSSPRSTSGESYQKLAVSISTRSRTTSQSSCARARRSSRAFGAPTAGFCPRTNSPSSPPSAISSQ